MDKIEKVKILRFGITSLLFAVNARKVSVKLIS